MKTRLEQLLAWRDSLAQGSVIIPDGCHGNDDYFGFDLITSKEHEELCIAANEHYQSIDSSLRIGGGMMGGEFIPYNVTQRSLNLKV